MLSILVNENKKRFDPFTGYYIWKQNMFWAHAVGSFHVKTLNIVCSFFHVKLRGHFFAFLLVKKNLYYDLVMQI